MAARTILWVDLRTTLSEPDLCSSLPKAYGAQRLRHLPDLLRAVQNWRPWAACFEYDVPDARGLAALAEVKNQHSSLPIVMLTEKPAKTLANWAFRRCVWDYLVKPVSVRHLCSCLTSIDKAVPPAERPAGRMPPASTSINVLAGKPFAVGTLAPAVSYVATNYPEKLCLATAARLCDLSPFQFSRNFKKEHGFTFRDFVVRVRIERAAELMKDSSVSVTEAAFVVGFNDLSYFARMFRRQLGVSPSHYRSESEPSQLLLFPLEELRTR
jgi:AraC-like DNA-binding protein/ActR/RegA family two-component response regulator